MFFISSLCIIVLVVLLFLYQNSSRALSYYNYNIIDERRFTLSSNMNYFDMFSNKSSGLPVTLARELEKDERLKNIQSYSLVELPVLAKFSLFEFGLETDIPIFSVTDSALSGATIPVGISRAMIDFYNMKVAGISTMFPRISELFIVGQSVKLTFGSSKIFPSLSHTATPIEGTISRIDENFPGFGLTLPESIVKEKLQEIGYQLAPPYKIVAYMVSTDDIRYIKSKYGAYNIQFDATKIQELTKQLSLVRNVFLGISLFFSSILGIFFSFLLFSFFRERRDVFRIVYIFGLSGIRARILTLAEPIFLIVSGSIIGSLVSYWIIDWLIRRGSVELINRGISYNLIPMQISFIGDICLFVCILFVGCSAILEYFWRRKSLMR